MVPMSKLRLQKPMNSANQECNNSMSTRKKK